MLEDKLKQLQTELQEVVTKINKLEEEKQVLLQEMLRKDGALKVVQELIKEQNS